MTLKGRRRAVSARRSLNHALNQRVDSPHAVLAGWWWKALCAIRLFNPVGLELAPQGVQADVEGLGGFGFVAAAGLVGLEDVVLFYFTEGGDALHLEAVAGRRR